MMKKNGFISITIIYTFFLVFALMLFLVMSSLINGRMRLNIFKKDIKETEARKNDTILADYIKSLSTTEIKVSGSNYRYVGSNPNNYIKFNGELWRIIGVYNASYCALDNCPSTVTKSMVKIVRKDSLGSLAWDCKGNEVGTSTSDNGSNNWTDSQLMMLLNPPMYKKSTYSLEGHSIKDTNDVTIYRHAGSYFNSELAPLKPAATTKGDGFQSISQATVCTSLTQTNCLRYLDDEAQAKIAPVEWNIYNESGSIVSYWKGKIGLPTMDELNKATSGTGCDTSLTSSCYTNDWLINVSKQWTMNKVASSSYSVNATNTSSSPYNASNACTSFDIRPTLYLQPDTVLTKGTGTSTDPYIVR